jgi:serralysin
VAPPTIAGFVAASGDGFDADGSDFDLLRAALDATGLGAALDEPTARLTVLAPTDDAFLGLARALGSGGTDEAEALGALLIALGELGGGDPLPVLEDVLLHHVLDGRFSRQQLEAIGEVHPLFGPVLAFSGAEIVDAEPDATARFLPGGGNVLAENGAVHAIGGVLLPLDLTVI